MRTIVALLVLTLLLSACPVAPELFTVTFNSREGSAVEPQVVQNGKVAIKPADPTRTGHVFQGWFTQPSGGELWDFSTPITTSLTLYAQWAAVQTNTVTFDSQGGSGVSQQELETDAPALEPEDPTKPGAVFQGWFTESIDGEAWDFSTPVSTALTLYAHWLYELSYASANEAEGTLSGILEQQVQHGKNGSAVTAVPASGFEFSHWSDSSTQNPRTDEQVEASLSITAYFTLKVYNVHYTAAMGGFLQGNVTQQVSHGNDGTLVEAVADEGYAFASWSDAAVPTQTRTDRNVKADLSVTANFAAISNTLSFDTQEGSPIADQILEWGETPTEPAQAPTRSGYRFLGWYADPWQDIQFDFSQPLDDDTIAFAHWIKQFTVTFDSQGGSPVVSPQVDDGYPVEEPDDPTKTGHVFLGWNTSSDGNGTDWEFGTESGRITADTTLYAKWKPSVNWLYYYAVGITSGAPPSASAYEYGSEVIVAGKGDLVKDGFTFAGWNVAIDGSGFTYMMNTVFLMPEHEVNLYAQWTNAMLLQLAYDGNGADGGSVPSPGDYAVGTLVEVQGNVCDLTRTGFYFDGWNTEEDGSGTTYMPGSTFTMPFGSLNLYAKWIVQQYAVYFNYANGEPVGEELVNHGTAIARPADPTYTGRTFAGWFADAGLTIPWDFSDVITSQTTLHAKWTVNKHSLAYDGNGGLGTPPADPTDYEYDNVVPVLNNTFTRAGYTFKEWNTKWDGTGSAYRPSATMTIPDQDVVLYAIWTPNEYMLSYHGNGHDAGTVPAALVKATGSEVTVAGIGNVEKIGHDFSGWNETADGSGKPWNPDDTLSMPPNALVLYAQWEPQSFTVVYDPAGGTFSGPSSIIVDYGTLLAEPADPVNDGYAFGGWKRSDNGELWNFGSDRVDSNLTLTAQWLTNQHVVQFNSQGGTAVQPVTVDHGTQVGEPTAPTRTGYVFAGWFDAATGGNEWVFPASINTSMTLYTQWTVESYEVVFNGTDIDPQDVSFNGLVSKPSDPVNVPYGFAGWFKDTLLLEPWDFGSDSVFGPTTLYPKWVVPAGSQLSVSAGDSHTLVVDSTGRLLLTGMNDRGQLGFGTTADSLVLGESLRGLDSFNAVSVAAGMAHTLVVDQDGTLWVSGMNRYYGQLGANRDPATVDSDSAVFLNIELPWDAVEVAAGLVHSLVLLENGDLYGAGYNGLRQLVDEDVTVQQKYLRIATDVVRVWAGGFNTFFKKADGSLWGAGYNRYGQLASGTTSEHADGAIPVVFALSNTPLRDVKEVAVGGGHTLFLLEDGRLYAAGLNSSGQLGIGTTEDKTQLTFVMDGVSSVAAGDYHSAVVKSDGTLWTFGSNAFGQLGDGTTTDRHTPVKVVSLGSKTFKVAAGYGHTVAVVHDLSVMGSGLNNHGQLGLGDTINRLVFTKAVDVE